MSRFPARRPALRPAIWGPEMVTKGCITNGFLGILVISGAQFGADLGAVCHLSGDVCFTIRLFCTPTGPLAGGKSFFIDAWAPPFCHSRRKVFLYRLFPFYYKPRGISAGGRKVLYRRVAVLFLTCYCKPANTRPGQGLVSLVRRIRKIPIRTMEILAELYQV